MKKTLTILGIAVVAVFVAFLIWFMFMRSDGTVPVGDIMRDLLPFGRGDDANLQPTTNDQQQSPNTNDALDTFANPTQNLFRLASTPVAGFGIISRNNLNLVRYVDRATGHIFEVSLPSTSSSTSLDKKRLTNNTLPKIYEAYFRADGEAVLVRSLREDGDIVENLSLTLTPPARTATSSSNEFYSVSSAPLRGQIDAVTPALSGNTLYYSIKDTSSIVSSTFSGTGAKTLLSIPFNEWRLSPAGNNLLASTKASLGAAGYSYILNTVSGSLNKVLGPLNGLVALTNPAGNRVIYSFVSGSSNKLSVRNLTNNTELELIPTTIAEKCAWARATSTAVYCGIPNNVSLSNEPDNWYRGASHFSDSIWRFDTDDGSTLVLYEPSQEFGALDISDSKLSAQNEYLVFVNRNDLTLWALRLPTE